MLQLQHHDGLKVRSSLEMGFNLIFTALFQLPSFILFLFEVTQYKNLVDAVTELMEDLI